MTQSTRSIIFFCIIAAFSANADTAGLAKPAASKRTPKLNASVTRVAVQPFTGVARHCAEASNEAEKACVDWAAGLDETLVGVPSCGEDITCTVNKSGAKAIVLGAIQYRYKIEKSLAAPVADRTFISEGTGLDCWEAKYAAKEALFQKMSKFTTDNIVRSKRPVVCQCKRGATTLAKCNSQMALY